jgi:hypothetical protein
MKLSMATQPTNYENIRTTRCAQMLANVPIPSYILRRIGLRRATTLRFFYCFIQ